MGATRRNLQAQPKLSIVNQKQLSEHQINQPTKISVKGAKIRIGATRRNLQAQPKILKKSSEHQNYQAKVNFPKKKYVQFLNSEKEPTGRSLLAQPKMLKKIVGTSNQPSQQKYV
jgi:hypothetical protein